MSFIRLLTVTVVICSLNGAYTVAAAADFNDVAKAIESDTGVKRMRTFGLGFAAKAYASLMHPAGASDIKFAIFNADESGRAIDGSSFESALTRTVDSSWKMVVRVRSIRGERTLIYTTQDKQNARNIHMLIATAKTDEAVITQITISAKQFLEWMSRGDYANSR